MIGWLIGRIKWLFVVALLGGPVLAYFGWEEKQRFAEIEAKGVSAQAVVTGATETKRRRGGKSYSVDLAWKDAKGTPMKAEKVSISQTMANEIISASTVKAAVVPIKYIADQPDVKPMIVHDAARLADGDELMIKLGLGAGGLGLLGTLGFFLLGRRKSAEGAA
jgi:hypothetical protein